MNAIFHCILHDDLDILKLICKSSHYPIDWTVKDSKGRTLITRIVNINDGYGYQHTEILEFISTQLSKAQFKKLIEIPDENGNCAIIIKKKCIGLNLMIKKLFIYI